MFKNTIFGYPQDPTVLYAIPKKEHEINTFWKSLPSGIAYNTDHTRTQKGGVPEALKSGIVYNTARFSPRALGPSNADKTPDANPAFRLPTPPVKYIPGGPQPLSNY